MTTPATPLVGSALSLVDRPRHEAVEELVALAGHRRPRLEAARSLLIARLHGRSDDFDAAQALQLVERALTRVGWEGEVVPELHPPRRHSATLMARIRQHLPRRHASSPSLRHDAPPRIAT